MSTTSTGNLMHTVQLQVILEDKLIEGHNRTELPQKLREAFIVYQYIRAELSLGEVNEILGLPGIEETKEWLHARGVATMRDSVDPEVRKYEKDSFQEALKEFV